MKRTVQQAALHSPQLGEPATTKCPPLVHHHAHDSRSSLCRAAASNSKRAKYSHKPDDISGLGDIDGAPAWLHEACSVFVESTPMLGWLKYGSNQCGGFYNWSTWLNQLCSRQFWTCATSAVHENCKSKSDSKTRHSNISPWLALVDACRASGHCCSAVALHSLKSDLVSVIINLVFRRAEANRLTDRPCKSVPQQDAVMCTVARHRRHESLLTLVCLLDTAFIYSSYRECRLELANRQGKANEGTDAGSDNTTTDDNDINTRDTEKEIESELKFLDSKSSPAFLSACARMQSFMWKHRWLPWYEQITGMRHDMAILACEAALSFCEGIPLPRRLPGERIATDIEGMNKWLVSLLHPSLVSRWVALAQVHKRAVTEGHGEEEQLMGEICRRVIYRVLELLLAKSTSCKMNNEAGNNRVDSEMDQIMDMGPEISLAQSLRIPGRCTFRQLLELYIQLITFGRLLHTTFYHRCTHTVEQHHQQECVSVFWEIRTRVLEIRPLIEPYFVHQLCDWCIAATVKPASCFKSETRNTNDDYRHNDDACLAYQHAAVFAALGPAITLTYSRFWASPTCKISDNKNLKTRSDDKCDSDRIVNIEGIDNNDKNGDDGDMDNNDNSTNNTDSSTNSSPTGAGATACRGINEWNKNSIGHRPSNGCTTTAQGPSESDPLVVAATIAEWDPSSALSILDSYVKIGKTLRGQFQKAQGNGLDLYVYRRVAVCQAVLERFDNDVQMTARLMSRFHCVWAACENDKGVGVFDNRGVCVLKSAIEKGNFEAASTYGIMLSCPLWADRRKACDIDRDVEEGLSYICKAVEMYDTAAAADLVHILMQCSIRGGREKEDKDRREDDNKIKINEEDSDDHPNTEDDSVCENQDSQNGVEHSQNSEKHVPVGEETEKTMSQCSRLEEKEEHDCVVSRETVLKCLHCLKVAANSEVSLQFFVGFLHSQEMPGVSTANWMVAAHAYIRVLVSQSTAPEYRSHAANNLGVLISLNIIGSSSSSNDTGTTTDPTFPTIRNLGLNNINGNGIKDEQHSPQDDAVDLQRNTHHGSVVAVEDMNARDLFNMARTSGTCNKAGSNLAAILLWQGKSDMKKKADVNKVEEARKLYREMFGATQGDVSVPVLQRNERRNGIGIVIVEVQDDRKKEFCEDLDVSGMELEKYGAVRKEVGTMVVVENE